MTKNQMAMHQIGRGHALTPPGLKLAVRCRLANRPYQAHLADLANRRIARREKLLAARMEQELEQERKDRENLRRQRMASEQ